MPPFLINSAIANKSSTDLQVIHLQCTYTAVCCIQVWDIHVHCIIHPKYE